MTDDQRTSAGRRVRVTGAERDVGGTAEISGDDDRTLWIGHVRVVPRLREKRTSEWSAGCGRAGTGLRERHQPRGPSDAVGARERSDGGNDE